MVKILVFKNLIDVLRYGKNDYSRIPGLWYYDEGTIKNNDRAILKENGIELAKGTIERLYEDNFNIYKAFTAASESIYLSYSSSGADGKTLRASMLVSKIKKLFPTIKEDSDIIKKYNEEIKKAFESKLNSIVSAQTGNEIYTVAYVASINGNNLSVMIV